MAELTPVQMARYMALEKHDQHFAALRSDEKLDVIVSRCRMRVFEGQVILDYTQARVTPDV